MNFHQIFTITILLIFHIKENNGSIKRFYQPQPPEQNHRIKSTTTKTSSLNFPFKINEIINYNSNNNNDDVDVVNNNVDVDNNNADDDVVADQYQSHDTNIKTTLKNLLKIESTTTTATPSTITTTTTISISKLTIHKSNDNNDCHLSKIIKDLYYFNYYYKERFEKFLNKFCLFFYQFINEWKNYLKLIKLLQQQWLKSESIKYLFHLFNSNQSVENNQDDDDNNQDDDIKLKQNIIDDDKKINQNKTKWSSNTTTTITTTTTTATTTNNFFKRFFYFFSK